MNPRLFSSAAAAAALSLAGAAAASPIHVVAQAATGMAQQGQATQARPAASAAAMKRASPADRTFVQKASEGGEKEIAASRLALAKSSDAEVKKFAQMMIDDHTKSGAELGGIARSEGVAPKGDPKAKGEAEAAKLKALSGPAFDKRYVATMHSDHVATVKLFQSEAKGGMNPALKGFAEKTLPTLQKHLEHVKTLKK